MNDIIVTYQRGKDDIEERATHIKLLEDLNVSEDIKEILVKSSDYNIFIFDIVEKVFVVGKDVSYGSLQNEYVNVKYFRDHPNEYTILDCSQSANFGEEFKLLCKNTEGEYLWFETHVKDYTINWDYFPENTSRKGKLKSFLTLLDDDE